MTAEGVNGIEVCRGLAFSWGKYYGSYFERRGEKERVPVFNLKIELMQFGG